MNPNQLAAGTPRERPNQTPIISVNDYNSQFKTKKKIQVPALPFVTLNSLLNLSLSFLIHGTGIVLYTHSIGLILDY